MSLTYCLERQISRRFLVPTASFVRQQSNRNVNFASNSTTQFESDQNDASKRKRLLALVSAGLLSGACYVMYRRNSLSDEMALLRSLQQTEEQPPAVEFAEPSKKSPGFRDTNVRLHLNRRVASLSYFDSLYCFFPTR